MDSAVNYWTSGQPNNWNTPGECIGLKGIHGYYWHDYENNLLLGAICEQKHILNLVRLKILYSLFYVMNQLCYFNIVMKILNLGTVIVFFNIYVIHICYPTIGSSYFLL